MNKSYPESIFNLLKKRYPDAKSSLDYSNPLELLVATILSAQCTDKRVNIVTKDLFKKYKTAWDYAHAKDFAKDIKSINFFNNKAKNIQNMAKILVVKYEGKVPSEMTDLLTLPGVARKTANVVLSNAFAKNEGIVVDTHVNRIANRLGLTKNTNPEKIEKDLIALFPRKDWNIVAHLFIYLGRDVCIARTPKCANCILAEICPSSLIKR